MAERHVHMPLHLNFKKLNNKKKCGLCYEVIDKLIT